MDINAANKKFWDELCGTSLAMHLGINDHSIESLRLFDQTYFNLYPYLLKYVKPERMMGKKVIEIGLGYGTLGQKIAESGAEYTGLDIAAGPVKMMKYRLRMKGYSWKAIQTSMLDCPIKSESLDYVISIGCFHHTGDIKRCIDETYRVLKHGGTCIIMVYNQFSLRQWSKWPLKTFLAMIKDLGLYNQELNVSESQKKAYDADGDGNAASETVFLSINKLKKMFNEFSSITLYKENCDNIILWENV